MTVLEPVINYIHTLTRPTVTLPEILDGTGRPRKPVLRVMDRLCRDGYVEEQDDNREQRTYRQSGPSRRNPTWKILRKPLVDHYTPRPKKNALRDKMWRVIRATRRFTRSDVKRLSGAGTGSVTDFTQLLEAHGVIRQIGKDSHQKVYLLVRDPGAKRPIFPEVKNDAQ